MVSIFLIVICTLLTIVFSLNPDVKYVRSSSTSTVLTLQLVNSERLLNTSKEAMDRNKLPLIYRPPTDVKILRALLIFYPIDQDDQFRSELRWFYRSWTEMMTLEPSTWRTDLLIYASDYVSLFKDLGCIYNQIRIDSLEKPTCRVFHYARIKNRSTKHEPSTKYQTIAKQLSQALYDGLRTYGYIDSINAVLEYYLSYSMYDFILRTDIDCFLTTIFAHYIPYNNSLLVGHGGYSTAFNSKRLKRIAHNMNWSYADMNSLGSTWYGTPSMAHRLSNFTLMAMIYLNMNEFTTPEREFKLGVMLWPEWHYGVLLLYGGHLAINHLVASENFFIRLADQLLDQSVTSKDQTDISKNLRLHLHCWHGDDPFSKFQFKEGKYDKIQSATLISDTSSSGYAMRIALESKSMTLEQLKQKLTDIKK